MRDSRYLSIVFYKAYADLRAESARTYTGTLWWIIEPILSLGVYYLVIGVILERGGPDFVPFLFVGLVAWRWLNVGLLHGSTAIADGRALMQQVYLPKIVFPTVALLSDTAKFAALFAILLLFLWLQNYAVGVAYLALPLLLGVEFLFISALTYLASAVVPFFPDLRMVLDNLLRLLFFVSGVFFAASAVPAEYRLFVDLNPMARLIEAYRDIMLYGEWPALWPLCWITLLSLAGIGVGARLIARYDRVYPKLA